MSPNRLNANPFQSVGVPILVPESPFLLIQVNFTA
jgi:hypothetical protein